MHDSKDGNPKTSHSDEVGSGEHANHASVTTPSVPSEPTSRRRRSGPAADRGIGFMLTTSPEPKTAVSPSNRSAMAPNPAEACPADEAAIHPPTVEMAMDCG